MKKFILNVLLMQCCLAIPADSTLTTDDHEIDPCQPFKPLIQNFTAPGRRINQVKCYEYILDFKNREDESNQKKECELKRRREGLGFNSGVLDYKNGEYPHMGALGWKPNGNWEQDQWVFKCGGSLISSKFVLTAAHCGKTVPSDGTVSGLEPKIVRFGDTNIQRNKRVRRVLAIHPKPVDVTIHRFVPYPQFNGSLRYYDIALIELETEVKFTMLVQPACLWNFNDVSSVQTKVTVSGWGVTDDESTTISSELQVSALDLVESTVCDNLLRNYHNRRWQGLKSHQICAGVLRGGFDTCKGDSGGPLQIKIDLPLKRSAMHYLIGVTSFGIGCGRPSTPAVYSRVSSFIDWIEDIVWPTSNA